MTLTTRPDGDTVESLSLDATASAAAAGAGLTVTYNAVSGRLQILGNASAATYETILQGIVYDNASDTPTTTNRSITIVARDSTNSSSVLQAVTLTVANVNDAPVLAAIGNRSVAEGATLSFTSSATDADVPVDTLTYSLDAASLLLGMTINASTGAFSWTPTEAQGG